MNAKQKSDQFSESEAQRRFLNALKVAVNTPPKPLKSMTRKRSKVQSNRRKKKRK